MPNNVTDENYGGFNPIFEKSEKNDSDKVLPDDPVEFGTKLSPEEVIRRKKEREAILKEADFSLKVGEGYEIKHQEAKIKNIEDKLKELEHKKEIISLGDSLFGRAPMKNGVDELSVKGEQFLQKGILKAKVSSIASKIFQENYIARNVALGDFEHAKLIVKTLNEKVESAKKEYSKEMDNLKSLAIEIDRIKKVEKKLLELADTIYKGKDESKHQAILRTVYDFVNNGVEIPADVKEALNLTDLPKAKAGLQGLEKRFDDSLQKCLDLGSKIGLYRDGYYLKNVSLHNIDKEQLITDLTNNSNNENKDKIAKNIVRGPFEKNSTPYHELIITSNEKEWKKVNNEVEGKAILVTEKEKHYRGTPQNVLSLNSKMPLLELLKKQNEIANEKEEIYKKAELNLNREKRELENIDKEIKELTEQKQVALNKIKELKKENEKPIVVESKKEEEKKEKSTTLDAPQKPSEQPKSHDATRTTSKPTVKLNVKPDSEISHETFGESKGSEITRGKQFDDGGELYMKIIAGFGKAKHSTPQHISSVAPQTPIQSPQVRHVETIYKPQPQQIINNGYGQPQQIINGRNGQQIINNGYGQPQQIINRGNKQDGLQNLSQSDLANLLEKFIAIFEGRNEQLSNMEAKINNLAQENQQLKAMLSKQAKENEAFKLQMVENQKAKEIELSDLKNKNDALRDDNNILNNENVSLKNDVAKIKKDYEDLLVSKKNIEKENGDLKQQLAEQIEKVKELEKNLSNVENQIASYYKNRMKEEGISDLDKSRKGKYGRIVDQEGKTLSLNAGATIDSWKKRLQEIESLQEKLKSNPNMGIFVDMTYVADDKEKGFSKMVKVTPEILNYLQDYNKKRIGEELKKEILQTPFSSATKEEIKSQMPPITNAPLYDPIPKIDSSTTSLEFIIEEEPKLENDISPTRNPIKKTFNSTTSNPESFKKTKSQSIISTKANIDDAVRNKDTQHSVTNLYTSLINVYLSVVDEANADDLREDKNEIIKEKFLEKIKSGNYAYNKEIKDILMPLKASKESLKKSKDFLKGFTNDFNSAENNKKQIASVIEYFTAEISNKIKDDKNKETENKTETKSAINLPLSHFSTKEDSSKITTISIYR